MAVGRGVGVGQGLSYKRDTKEHKKSNKNSHSECEGLAQCVELNGTISERKLGLHQNLTHHLDRAMKREG